MRLSHDRTPQRLWAAGTAGGELLEWTAMLGATGLSGPPAFIEAQMQFGHAYAARPCGSIRAAMLRATGDSTGHGAGGGGL
jgi:hypothetical protein